MSETASCNAWCGKTRVVLCGHTMAPTALWFSSIKSILLKCYQETSKQDLWPTLVLLSVDRVTQNNVSWLLHISMIFEKHEIFMPSLSWKPVDSSVLSYALKINFADEVYQHFQRNRLGKCQKFHEFLAFMPTAAWHVTCYFCMQAGIIGGLSAKKRFPLSLLRCRETKLPLEESRKDCTLGELDRKI